MQSDQAISFSLKYIVPFSSLVISYTHFNGSPFKCWIKWIAYVFTLISENLHKVSNFTRTIYMESLPSSKDVNLNVLNKFCLVCDPLLWPTITDSELILSWEEILANSNSYSNLFCYLSGFEKPSHASSVPILFFFLVAISHSWFFPSLLHFLFQQSYFSVDFALVPHRLISKIFQCSFC